MMHLSSYCSVTPLTIHCDTIISTLILRADICVLYIIQVIQMLGCAAEGRYNLDLESTTNCVPAMHTTRSTVL